MKEVLAESIILSMVGGVAGAIGAMGMAAALSSALPVSLTVAPAVLAFALLAAAGSGAVAGWYPAVRATRLDVIDAIRAD
jgi:putative ABC transport system permease protein